MRKITTLLILLITSWGFTQAQITLPYSENLELEGTGSTGCGAAQTFSVINWTNESGDDADWVIDVSGTGSSSTGPTANGGADHNPGVSGTKYLYIEASGCVTDTANLVSDEIYTDGTEPNLFFDFWYHQYGAQINMNIVQVRQVIGGNPQPWVALDTLFTPPPGLDMWQNGLYDLSSYVGDTFQLRFRGVTGTSFGSDNALDDFNVYSIAANDAGVTSIDAPTSPTPVGPNNVDVTIMNFGTDTLFNANVEWEFNGTPQTTLPWTGSLINGQSVSGVNLGSVNITPGLFKIKAWTSMPNMVIDSVNGNDTTMITGCSGALRGTYTAGGPGADFDDMATLSFVLSTCGIDSHTIINVNPGFYAERLILDHVPGTDTNATLKIDGGDPALVTISNTVGATIYLNGTDYTTICRMTIEAMGTIDNYGVQLRDTAEFNTIDSCVILMDDATTNLSDVIGVSASNTEASSFSEGQNALWTTVSNCHIYGGEKGIHFEGQNANRNVGNRFINNMIEDAEDYGFYMDDQDSMLIYMNTVTGLRTTFADAFYCFDIQMFTIEKNMAVDVPDWGIYIADGNFGLDGTPTSRGRIVNNCISSISDYAAYFDDFENTDIWYNTFANTSTFAGAIRINDFTGLDVQNNIFYSGGDYAWESDDLITGTPNVVNYNLYFSTPGNTGLIDDQVNVYNTLAAWQTAVPTANQNSVEGDPVFLSPVDDLRPLAPIVNGNANPAVPVTEDVTCAPRDSINPDLGCHEFTPLNNDAAAILIIEPNAGCGDSNLVVKIIRKCLGLIDITSLEIKINGTLGGVPFMLTFTAGDTLSFNQTDTVTVGTINAYNGGVLDLNGYVTLIGDQNVTNDTFPPYSVTITPFEPQGLGGVGCGVDSTYIYAAPYSGVLYYWFNTAIDTVPIGSGDSLFVPSITAQSTYYLQYANNADSLATPFNTNNGAGGNMWDVIALNTVTIQSLAMNFDPGTVDVDVWYRTGTWVGNDQNQNNDWILIGSATGITTAGLNLPTQIPLPINVTIPAGDTVAFYVQETSGGNLVNYTNGTGVGNILAQNADLQILEGCGKATTTNFNTSTFSPRLWNGIMYYGSTACSNIRVPVTALASPGVSTSLGNDTTVCSAAYTLDAGTNATNYDWSTSATTQTITATASGTYSIVVSDTFGCDAADSINLTINTPPSVNLGSDTLLCNGDSITLDAGNSGSSYLWSTGGTGQIETVSIAGIVNVVVTDSNGCIALDTVTIDTGSVPTPNFSLVTAGDSVTFMNLSVNPGPTTYLWDFGDGNTSNLSQGIHTYTANGTYIVTLTCTNNCGSTLTTWIVQVTGVISVEQALAGGVVSLYPNPNTGRFNLEFRGLLADDVELRIMDVKGQVVMETSIEEQGSFVKAIDMTNFAKGMYLLQITAQGEQVMQRFVVE